MGIIDRLKCLFFKEKKVEIFQPAPHLKKTANHEAAHGIIWYIFRENWIVNQLTIESNNLPEDNMQGALHITANFDSNKETNIQYANEIAAIALAGLIGQNLDSIKQNPQFITAITLHPNYMELLDSSGCGGDFEIINQYLPNLGVAFGVSKYEFLKYKILDLIILFQDDYKIAVLHDLLSKLLLEKGTLLREELLNFFEKNRFAEYIEEEDLESSFFHRN